KSTRGRRRRKSLETRFQDRMVVPVTQTLFRQVQYFAGRSGLGRRRKRGADHKCACEGEICKERTVLMVDGGRDQRAILALLEARAQVVLANVVGCDIAAEHGPLSGVLQA